MEFIQKTKDNINPVAIIATGMNFIKQYGHLSGPQKKELLVKSIESLANGADDIPGTADDVLPQKVVQVIRVMLQTDLVSQTIDVMADVTKGKFDTIKKVNWFTCCKK